MFRLSWTEKQTYIEITEGAGQTTPVVWAQYNKKKTGFLHWLNNEGGGALGNFIITERIARQGKTEKTE